ARAAASIHASGERPPVCYVRQRFDSFDCVAVRTEAGGLGAKISVAFLARLGGRVRGSRVVATLSRRPLVTFIAITRLLLRRLSLGGLGEKLIARARGDRRRSLAGGIEARGRGDYLVFVTAGIPEVVGVVRVVIRSTSPPNDRVMGGRQRDEQARGWCR